MTPLFTPRGLPVSTGAPGLAAAIHAFEEEILDYGNGAGALFAALPLDPDCGLASAYAAALHLFRSTRDGCDQAAPLARAALRRSAGTARERGLIAAIAHWSAGEHGGAVAILRDHVRAEPGDLFAARLLQHLLFATGDVGAMLATIEPVVRARADDARVLAMYAFALDQNARHRDAEAAARAAIEIAPDPWAHHAIAHVMDAEARFDEGRRWMRAHADAWANCTSFLYTHNWWHAALFHLALGDRDGALALYHARVWAARKDYVQDQVNAVSLLARLELVGVDVGDCWQDVARFVRPRRTDAVDGFLDLHYAYALARAGDMAGVRDLTRARAMSAADGTHCQRVALVAVGGVAAFALGRYEEAARSLGAVAGDLAMLGGSTVQRQVFATMLAHARAGVACTSPLGLAA